MAVVWSIIKRRPPPVELIRRPIRALRVVDGITVSFVGFVVVRVSVQVDVVHSSALVGGVGGGCAVCPQEGVVARTGHPVSAVPREDCGVSWRLANCDRLIEAACSDRFPFFTIAVISKVIYYYYDR